MYLDVLRRCHATEGPNNPQNIRQRIEILQFGWSLAAPSDATAPTKPQASVSNVAFVDKDQLGEDDHGNLWDLWEFKFHENPKNDADFLWCAWSTPILKNHHVSPQRTRRYYSLTFRDAQIWCFLLVGPSLGAVLRKGGDINRLPVSEDKTSPFWTPFLRWTSVRHFLRFADFLQLKSLSTPTYLQRQRSSTSFSMTFPPFSPNPLWPPSLPTPSAKFGNKVVRGSVPALESHPSLLSPNFGCKAKQSRTWISHEVNTWLVNGWQLRTYLWGRLGLQL